MCGSPLPELCLFCVIELPHVLLVAHVFGAKAAADANRGLEQAQRVWAPESADDVDPRALREEILGMNATKKSSAICWACIDAAAHVWALGLVDGDELGSIIAHVDLAGGCWRWRSRSSPEAVTFLDGIAPSLEEAKREAVRSIAAWKLAGGLTS